MDAIYAVANMHHDSELNYSTRIIKLLLLNVTLLTRQSHYTNAAK